jgi:undecaprenyl-diphosphatase
VLAGTVLTVVAVNVSKDAVERARPPGALVETLGLSYPSGHAAYSVAWLAVALALGRVVPRLRHRAGLLIPALAVTLFVGSSRVYLGAHYLTDVLGGWGLGLACFSLCGLLVVAVAALRQNEGGRGPARASPPP